MPSTIEQINERIAELIQQNPDEIGFVGGVSDDWIRKAEQALATTFPPSLVTYLRQYGGGAICGEQINGIVGVEFDEAYGPDIVFNTRIERREFEIPDTYICLVNNEGDEMFYLDTSIATDGNENPVVRVQIEQLDIAEQYAQSFAEFLLKRIQFYFPA